MATKTKKAVKSTAKEVPEKDSVYFLKLVIFFILGCLWIRLGSGAGVPIPVGLVFGVLLASHEHFQVDRKIEYVVLLFATVLSFIAPIGFVLNIG
jgi:4-hydroxybenzoate polyprenyltransferase